MSDWVVSCHAESTGTTFKCAVDVIVHGYQFDSLYHGLASDVFLKIRQAAQESRSAQKYKSPVDLVLSRVPWRAQSILYSKGADIEDYSLWGLGGKWDLKQMSGIFSYPSWVLNFLPDTQDEAITLSEFIRDTIMPTSEDLTFYWLACNA
ncbi:hypothetical protein DY968_12965 [Pseudomonas aeruginosa]|uniref:hypothetical protein n=1 Tax=Pseudomonas aeruginosa TaxID=287 RepID=UPI000F82E366|nr:hypothetical protein [Pseudomonas aeruginosa]RTU18929.1 hypothetical protein DY968_12965 [Pseudomonas aeruginosa]